MAGGFLKELHSRRYSQGAHLTQGWSGHDLCSSWASSSPSCEKYRISRVQAFEGSELLLYLGIIMELNNEAAFFQFNSFFPSSSIFFFYFNCLSPLNFIRKTFFFFYSCSSCFWQLIRSHILILILITSNTRS
ncbi:hypothetical protein POPTR_006G202351v4 [Populus trichocarpa]|uniref:Uncharacterized protein n=1 Tax=Populus trichocarpa TaxID=3694 RepID=A0ACC0SVL8_POPTR|nr:hypothetical protein POPTR_006G202351v4 [Populus trichocarpa]